MSLRIKLVCAASGLALTAGAVFAPVDAVAADDGYGGLIAPSPSTTRSKAADEPPGYQGLIPGYVAPSAEDTGDNSGNAGIDSPTPIGEIPPSPAEAAKKYKPPKGNFFGADKVKRSFGPGVYSKPKHNIRAKSVEDIKVIKLSMGPDEEYVADPKIFRNVKLPTHVRHQLLQRKRNEEGLWDSEADTKQKIDTMVYLLNQAQTAREKQEVVAQINEKLDQMRDVIVTKQRLPEGIQIAVGVPRQYIEQEREAAQGSLRRIKEMKKALRQF